MTIKRIVALAVALGVPATLFPALVVGHQEFFNGDGGPNVFEGHLHEDTFDLGGGDDGADAKQGGDNIDLGADADFACGGAGQDVIWGRLGDDDHYSNGRCGTAPIDNGIFGGENGDIVEGNAGGDWVTGGDQEDSVYGGDGNDRVDGVLGENDNCGGDALYGGDGSDACHAHDGDAVSNGCNQIIRYSCTN